MPFTYNPDQTFVPDMLNAEVDPEDDIPVEIYGRLNRYVLNNQPRNIDVWYFLFNYSIYLADTDEVAEAQHAHPGVRDALESLTHGRRRGEVMELPCYHTPSLLPRLHTREHRQWDFIQWWENVRPGRPLTPTVEVNSAAVATSTGSLSWTFDEATAGLRRSAETLRQRAERRRRSAVPEEGQADAPRWDGLPSSHSLLAQRTRRGDGSCIDRQASAVCPPSCPCRTSQGA